MDSSNGTTWVLSAKLENTFRKVRDLQEFVRQYVLVPDKIPVSIEDTQWAIEQKYELKIDKIIVDFEAKHIRGMMERYKDGTAKVYVRKNQDPDPQVCEYWCRFIAIKEMIHLAIDEQEDWSPNGVATIEELIRDHSFEQLRPARQEIQSEHLAEVAAFELLYPMEFRQGDIEKGVAFSKLADEYEVPEHVVERVLDPSYMKMARALWNEIGGHGLGGLGSNPAGS